MQQLRKIDWGAVVSPIARSVKLRYNFESEFGGALLHRTSFDSSPIELVPPDGQIEVELVEPQAIYIQELDGSDGFVISAVGFTL